MDNSPSASDRPGMMITLAHVDADVLGGVQSRSPSSSQMLLVKVTRGSLPPHPRYNAPHDGLYSYKRSCEPIPTPVNTSPGSSVTGAGIMPVPLVTYALSFRTPTPRKKQWGRNGITHLYVINNDKITSMCVVSRMALPPLPPPGGRCSSF